MIQKIVHTVLLVSLLSSARVGAFVVNLQLAKQTSTQFSFHKSTQSFQSQSPAVANRFLPDAREKSTLLKAEKKGYDDGVDRGIPILAVTMLVILWCFTIPPEFRRAYICSDRCVDQRENPQCNNCVTGEEWSNGVKEYYRNGGGIQWDFSIDPNSKMKLF